MHFCAHLSPMCANFYAIIPRNYEFTLYIFLFGRLLELFGLFIIENIRHIFIENRNATHGSMPEKIGFNHTLPLLGISYCGNGSQHLGAVTFCIFHHLGCLGRISIYAQSEELFVVGFEVLAVAGKGVGAATVKLEVLFVVRRQAVGCLL